MKDFDGIAVKDGDDGGGEVRCMNRPARSNEDQRQEEKLKAVQGMAGNHLVTRGFRVNILDRLAPIIVDPHSFERAPG